MKKLLKNEQGLIAVLIIVFIVAIAIIAIALVGFGDKDDNSRTQRANNNAEDSENKGEASADIINGDDSYYSEDDYDEDYPLRHAPNMYVDWQSTADYAGSYDTFIIDWKCTETADYTYWAVHEWDGGYAGFQDRGEECDVVLLSLWDLPDGTQPQVEYYSEDYDYGDFSHEGCGAYVFTPYDWEVGVWYSMKIEITYEENKTIFTQYVCREGEDWLKTAALSYPTITECTRPTHVFQEDYAFNNLSRSCVLRNAGGRFRETEKWDYWDKYIVDSSYYPTENDDDSLWSVSFGCDYKAGKNTVEIFSGGRGNIPSGKEMPYEGNFR